VTTFRAVFSYGWKIALGAGLFAYVATLVDWPDVYAKLRGLSPIYFLVGTFIVFLQAGILGWRWQRIGKFDRIDIPVRPHAKATLISFFFSQGLPASLGADAFRVWWYARQGVSTARALKIVAYDRIIGLVSLAAVCAASIAVFVARLDNSAAIDSLIVIVGVALAGFVALILPFTTGVTRLLSRLSEKLPPAPARLLSWLIELRQLFRSGSLVDIGLILLPGVAVHLLTVLLGYALATGLGSAVGFLDCLAAIAPALLVSYVPISVAGWGVREVSIVFAFGLVGVDRETALLVSLGIGIIVLLVSLVGGLLWAISGMRRISVMEERKGEAGEA
jgi:glycosyltransferase 2 family protein